MSFRHVAELDGSTSRPAEVVFPVRLNLSGGGFIAAAFFPNDPVGRRQLLINSSYFRPRSGSTPSACSGTSWVTSSASGMSTSGAALRPPAPGGHVADHRPTAYDPRSVMHHFWAASGTPSSRSPRSTCRSQRVYGMPLSSFRLVA